MTLSEFANTAIEVPFLDQGRNWSGWDCWGLIVTAYREIFGITLRTYDYSCADDGPGNSAIIDQYKGDEWIKVADERPGDIILLRNGRLACHGGLIIEKGLMLHTQKIFDTCIERYNSPIWQKRIVAFYRHARFSAGK